MIHPMYGNNCLLIILFYRSKKLKMKPLVNSKVKSIAEQSLITPARCCLKNIGQVGASDDVRSEKAPQVDLSVEEVLVEKAFRYLGSISKILMTQFNLHS